MPREADTGTNTGRVPGTSQTPFHIGIVFCDDKIIIPQA